MRLLVVENNPLVRDVIAEGLRQAGYDVGEASSGVEALALLDEQDADVLVIDIELAGGLTGWDVAVRAREKSPNIAVIYASGFAPDATREVPRSRHLTKPFKPGQVIALATEIALERGL